ncbi:MAG: hypothetical protein PHG80_09215 [Methanoregulaceae archaeon]|jgi:uncharacterized membrane protein (Fun14 family)|nr:hypothetical protein [Methanoregulaceae archaeon]
MTIKDFKEDFKKGYNNGVITGMALSTTEKIFLFVVGAILTIAAYAFICM